MKYLIKWLIPYWKRHKYRMLLIVFLGITSAIFQAAIPFYIKKIINGFEKNLNLNYLIKNVIIMLFLGLFHFIVNLFAQRNRAYMNYRTEYEVREKAFSHLLSLDEYIFIKYNSGEILTRLIDDISEKISWFSCSGVFRFIQAIFTLITIISVMIYLNIKLTLISLIPMPFMVYFVVREGKILNKKYEELQKSISNVYDYLETSFSGIKVLKANLKEKYFGEKFSELTLQQMLKSIDSEKKQILVHYIFFFTGFLSVFLVYLFGGLLVIEGSLTVGDLVSFQIYTFMLIWPFSDVSQFFVSANRAYVSVKRVDEILNFKPMIICAREAKKISQINQIELLNLSFVVGDKKLLDNINLKITRGQKIAVVGKIGGSKSTLLKVIARILQYTLGKFYLNSIPVENYDLKDYQRRISYISQEAPIFSDTILNNITMFSNYTEEEIKTAIKIAQLEKDIHSFQQGINTIVGNKGTTLSGGQRQRISLARALIRDPDLLIMDDSTNQMDAETEHMFWTEFLNHFSHVTAIFVTHRTSTIEKSDMVIVMDKGRIIEKGHHSELISGDTLYKQIYKKYKMEE
ncbi:MAG: ABC transporter ATP-binding protein/permease [Elusimicrobiota bacterium]